MDKLHEVTKEADTFSIEKILRELRKDRALYTYSLK